MTERHVSFCRFCHAYCGIIVTVEDGRAVRVDGDKDNPLFRGYTCVKGRHLPDQHYNPERLLHSMKRIDGTHRPLPSEQVMDEIAGKLTDIVRRHGPRAVAIYAGTYSYIYECASPMAYSWLHCVGSPMFFTPLTIDQAGKAIAGALHGRWGAPPQSMASSDVWMLVGTNPIVSMLGADAVNPNRLLLENIRRGMKLIVIDPRRTECAALAAVHLQLIPGEDATVLAGLLRAIIRAGLHDEDFIRAEVQGFAELAAAVEPFSPEYVERRAGVPSQQLLAAAHMFGSARRGGASGGTGTNMAPHPNLNEYLIHSLNTICGRWSRAGEQIANPYVLFPPRDARAQALPKPPLWGSGTRLRGGQRETVAGLPVTGLADEMLMPGEGQVRAFINIGGNPIAAWPDPLKTERALAGLELSVSLDTKLSATSRRCDYVIAPKLSLEQPATTQFHETDILVTTWGGNGFPVPFAQYTPAIVSPPADSDLLEEWEFFFGLGQRMGLSLSYKGVTLDMQHKPNTEELLQIGTAGGRIALDRVKQHPHGAMFPDPPLFVKPKEAGCLECLDVGNSLMVAELAEVAAAPLVGAGGYEPDSEFAYRLISRRMRHVYNSSGRDIPDLMGKYRHNPAFMNPADIAAEGLETGAIVEIESGHGAILGIVDADDTVRRGVISMSHAFGDVGARVEQLSMIGSTTSSLCSTDKNVDPISGMPLQSAIPVNIRRHAMDFASSERSA